MEGAIAIYYRHLLQYTVETMHQKFSDAHNMPNFVKAVPIVCAGGASQIPGFLELFKEELEKSRGFPVKIDFIRMAREPMQAGRDGLPPGGARRDERVGGARDADRAGDAGAGGGQRDAEAGIAVARELRGRGGLSRGCGCRVEQLQQRPRTATVDAT
jgi:hypothetical protein